MSHLNLPISYYIMSYKYNALVTL